MANVETVRVQCPCGWAFSTPATREGSNVRCPGCRGSVQVPLSDPLGIGRLSLVAAGPPTNVFKADLSLPSVSSRGYDLDKVAIRVAYMAAGSVVVLALAILVSSLVSALTASSSSFETLSAEPAPRIDAQTLSATASPSNAPTSLPPPPLALATEPAQTSPAESSTTVIPLSGAARSNDASAFEADVALARLPESSRQWLEQSGVRLAGLRRVGSTQTAVAQFSWMTSLLPFLDHGELHQQIDFSKPPTSPQNLKAAVTVVPEFINPLEDRQRFSGYPFDGLAVTHFAGMSGVEDARNVVAAKLPRSDPRAGVFGYDEVARPADIKDGTSQTIMMVGSGATANPWMFGGGGTIRGAREPLFDKTSGLGTKGLAGGGALVVMVDGSVRHVNENVDPRVFKAMCTIHGADSVDLNAAPSFALENLGRPSKSLSAAGARGRTAAHR